jgi:hypothetical protein
MPGASRYLGREVTRDDITIKQDVGVVFDQPFYPGNWTVAQVGRAIEPFYTGWDNGLFLRSPAGSVYLRASGCGAVARHGLETHARGGIVA